MLQRFIRIISEVATAVCLAVDRPLIFALAVAVTTAIITTAYWAAEDRAAATNTLGAGTGELDAKYRYTVEGAALAAVATSANYAAPPSTSGTTRRSTIRRMDTTRVVRRSISSSGRSKSRNPILAGPTSSNDDVQS